VCVAFINRLKQLISSFQVATPYVLKYASVE